MGIRGTDSKSLVSPCKITSTVHNLVMTSWPLLPPVAPPPFIVSPAATWTLTSSVCLSVCLSVLSVQQRERLDGVMYSSRFAVALFFCPDVVFSFPWAARYVTDNHCIRYIAADARKRNAGVSICLLTCPSFCSTAHH